MPAINIEKNGEVFVTKQHESIKETLPVFLEKVNPTRVIEIGSLNFGLTALISNHFDGQIITYEIDETRMSSWRRLHPHAQNIELRMMSVFDDMDRITNEIQSDGTTLVMCDGGDKIKEFNTFAPYLKKGDVICAHDFQDPAWNGIRPSWVTEISTINIMEVVINERLKDYESDLMLPSVWGCYQK